MKPNTTVKQCENMVLLMISYMRQHSTLTACNCSMLGTVNNLGCDKHTGECVCKQNVVGEQCDRCAVGHYGLLSNYTNGCLQCDCDEGGAFDNNCDMATGQCRCRPHAVGRRCDAPEQGYFAPWLDYLRTEAENSELSPVRNK